MSVDISGALTIEKGSSAEDLEWLATAAVGKQKIIELGSYHGRSTRAMLDNSDAHIWCVDSWQGSEYGHGLVAGDADYAIFLENIGDVRERVTILRMFTRKAADLLPKASFDMIFIDADHSYEAVKFDIMHYAPLLREGGLLCGHDMGREEVDEAVEKLLASPRKGGKAIWWAIKEKGWMYGVDLTKALQIPVTSSMFIHDLHRLAEIAVGCRRIVELGSYHGRSTRAMLDSSQAQIWCIDCWELPIDEKGRGVSDADLQIFLNNIQDVRDRVVILRMLTREAAGLLPEECFDMVVIDADHSYEAVKFDILHYAPLLHEGGILCGHDYRPGEGVTKAVDELLLHPEVLHKGVVWWAEKKEGWLREETKTHREDLYYVCEIASD